MNPPLHPQPLTVLLCAEAVTLTHVARPAVLVRALAAAGHHPVLACPDRWPAVWRGLPGKRVPLISLDPKIFLARLAAGTAVYLSTEIRRMVLEDLSLFDAVRPDVVVGDFRISLAISARLAGIPYVNLINAYWNPAAQVLPWPVPENPLVSLMGSRLSGCVFRAVQPLIRRLHARPSDAVRRECGLAPLTDVRRVYCDADLCLHPDPHGMVRMASGGPPHRVIGHLAWSPPDCDLPSWWADLPPGRSCIYVSMGSSGAVQRLSAVIAGAVRAGLPVVVSTAGRLQVPAQSGVMSAEWLPGEVVAQRARLVICNGGSPSAYQALAGGALVLGITSNLDQYLAMDSLAAAGLGVRMRAGEVTADRITATATALLGNDAMTARVEACASALTSSDAATTAVAAIVRLADRNQPSVRTRSPDIGRLMQQWSAA